MSAKDDKILEQARKRYKQGREAIEKQLGREVEDLRFYEGEGQWPTEIRRMREGAGPVGGLPPVPARPCITINKTREPIRHVVAGIRQADLGVEVVPADDFEPQTGPIDHTEIELREGLIRRIQRQSEATDARMWAADRAVKAGRGFYGMITRYLPGKTLDQEVCYRRFYDQSCVTPDPAHEQPDGSDAEWWFVETPMRYLEYQAEYGKQDDYGIITDSANDWSNLTTDYPDWFKGNSEADKDTRIIVIREYWFTEREERTLYKLADGQLAYRDELPKDFVTKDLESRKVVEKKVKFIKTDGLNVLETTDWPSPYLPFVKTLGEEIQPYDDQRRAEGMVRPAREPGQGFNFMASALVETIALTPKSPVIGAAGQFEGFEEAWNEANVRNIGRLEYNAVVDGVPGQLGPPAPVQYIQSQTVAAISGALGMFNEAIKSTTGIPDPTLGNVDPSLKSGRAIKTLLDQARIGSSSYLDNVVLSAKHEARILNSLLFPIYGRQGRLLRLMNGENEPSSVLYDTPFVSEGEGPQARPVPFDQSKHDPQQMKQFKLTEGADWNIAVKVAKNYDTRREAQQAELFDLLNNDPQGMLPIIGDLAFKYDDGPASPEIEKRLKAVLNPAIQQMLAGNQTQDPQAQQAMAQAQQATQLLQAELQKAQQALQSKTIEGQVTLQKTQMEIESRERIAQLQEATQLATVQAKVDAEDARTFVDAMEQRLSKQLQVHLKLLDHVHERVMAKESQNGHQEGESTQPVAEVTQEQA